MSSIDLTQLPLENRRQLEELVSKYTVVDGKLVPPLSELDSKAIQGHVIDSLRVGDLTADVIRFSTEGLVQVCLGLLNPVVKHNQPERPE